MCAWHQQKCKTICSKISICRQQHQVTSWKTVFKAPSLHHLTQVATWNTSFLPTQDLQEAVTAFFEKRPPNFGGR